MQSQRWIVVADSPFLPATNGGQQEHLGFVRAAVEAGNVALLVLPDGDTVDLAPYSALLNGAPTLPTARRTHPWLLLHPTKPFVVASRPVPDGLIERAKALAPDATGIVIFSYKSRAIGEALAVGLGLPTVMRQHNREGAYHRSLAEQTPGPRGWVYHWEAKRIERDERALSKAAWLTGTADISLADAEWRRSTGARNVTHVPPFARTLSTENLTSPPPSATHDARDIADAKATEEAPPDEFGDALRVVFVGSLEVATNVGGLQWFLSRVWPRVIAQRPDVALDVIGRNPTAEVRAAVATAERAHLLIDVPKIGPYLNRAAVAINPVVSGSGVNIKLIDYLDAAVPLVSTSLATRGLPLRPGVDLEVHDDPQAFADAVLSLLENPARATEMAESGREHLNQLLDPQRNLALIAKQLGA